MLEGLVDVLEAAIFFVDGSDLRLHYTFLFFRSRSQLVDCLVAKTIFLLELLQAQPQIGCLQGSLLFRRFDLVLMGDVRSRHLFVLNQSVLEQVQFMLAVFVLLRCLLPFHGVLY